MRLRHFEALRPVCPRCRLEGREDCALEIGARLAASDDDVEHGILHCPHAACRMEYPIIDGIPVLFANLRQYLAENAAQLLARNDLPDVLESLVGDCHGPGTAYENTRLYLSTYGHDHYGEFDPQAGDATVDSGPRSQVVACLDAALALVDDCAGGPAIDLGCAVGRCAFELAGRGDSLVLGVDYNFPMLQVARRALTTGRACYPLRRIGVVYDRRAFEVRFAGSERVDFWACDALALPFAAGCFDLVTAFNLLDAVASPRDLLQSVARALRPGGHALLSMPYDWSTAATPVEAWIGGHSQRGPDRGAAEPLLRSLLTAGAHPQGIERLALHAEIDRFPWRTRLHERSTVEYDTHVVAAIRD